MASLCLPALRLGFHSLVMIKPSPSDTLRSGQIELLVILWLNLQLSLLCAFAQPVSSAWKALYQTVEMAIIFLGPSSFL